MQAVEKLKGKTFPSYTQLLEIFSFYQNAICLQLISQIGLALHIQTSNFPKEKPLGMRVMHGQSCPLAQSLFDL